MNQLPPAWRDAIDTTIPDAGPRIVPQRMGSFVPNYPGYVGYRPWWRGPLRVALSLAAVAVAWAFVLWAMQP